MANQERGYTHVVFSWSNARAQAGQSITDFRADCVRARAMGLRVHCKIWSKDFDAHNMSLAQWMAYADPIFDALAGAVDEYSPWEYDSGNLDGDTAVDVHRYLGQRAHAQGASFWCHFYPAHAFWHPNGDAYWWNVLGVDVDGLDYQGANAWAPEWSLGAKGDSWDIGDLQARSVDILNLFASTGHKFRQFEPGTPMVGFTHDHPNEDDGDGWGYLAACTKAKSPVWGFGAGARMPDGTAI